MPRRLAASHVAVSKGASSFWQTACTLLVEAAVFMFSMIFAFVLITMTTVVMTVFAMLLMRWMLGRGRIASRVPADTFRADDAQVSRARP